MVACRDSNETPVDERGWCVAEAAEAIEAVGRSHMAGFEAVRSRMEMCNTAKIYEISGPEPAKEVTRRPSPLGAPPCRWMLHNGPPLCAGQAARGLSCRTRRRLSRGVQMPPTIAATHPLGDHRSHTSPSASPCAGHHRQAPAARRGRVRHPSRDLHERCRCRDGHRPVSQSAATGTPYLTLPYRDTTARSRLWLT